MFIGVIMATMTLALPDELKREMDRRSVVNWSAVAREAFIQEINKLRVVEALTKDSKLTEKDVEELGKRIKAGILKAHDRKTT